MVVGGDGNDYLRGWEETSRRMAQLVNRKLIMFFNRKLRTVDEKWKSKRSKWSRTGLRFNTMMNIVRGYLFNETRKLGT